jgi:hypothetical protein
MDPTNSRIYLSRKVVFDETCFPAKEKVTPSLFSKDFSTPLGMILLPSHLFSINSMTTAHTHDTVKSHVVIAFATPSIAANSPPSSVLALDSAALPPVEPCSPTQPALDPCLSLQPSIPSIPIAPTPVASIPLTRSLPLSALLPTDSHRVTWSQIGHLKPKAFPDFHMYNATKHPLHTFVATTLPREPTTYLHAATHPEWFVAMALKV